VRGGKRAGGGCGGWVRYTDAEDTGSGAIIKKHPHIAACVERVYETVTARAGARAVWVMAIRTLFPNHPIHHLANLFVAAVPERYRGHWDDVPPVDE